MTGADWELDFYSRPILESDGRKRWELLVTASPDGAAGDDPFRFAKRCPSGDVNSLWLSAALKEAIETDRMAKDKEFSDLVHKKVTELIPKLTKERSTDEEVSAWLC